MTDNIKSDKGDGTSVYDFWLKHGSDPLPYGMMCLDKKHDGTEESRDIINRDFVLLAAEIARSHRTRHGWNTDLGYLVYSICKVCLAFALIVGYIRGFQLADGWVSTLFCVIPFWSWYLSICEVIQYLLSS